MTGPLAELSVRLAVGWMDAGGKRHLCRIPDIAIWAAAVTGCPLAHACVCLDLESSGGMNIFSAPRTPGCGQPHGTLVTEQTWQAYLARRNECGTQGAGPLQLTWAATQDMADERGGCWRLDINVRVGLEQFIGHLRRTGSVRDSFSLYNTGKPGPSAYADKALALLPSWQRIIDG